MKRFLDIDYWRAVARNPLALAGLALDLAPAVAVVFWGWGAAPLLALYWIENLILGLVTAPRILIAAVARDGWAGMFGGGFLLAFFTFHYGIFCLVHGGLMLTFLTGHDFMEIQGTVADDALAMLGAAFALGRNMDWLAAMLGAWHLAALAYWVLDREWRASGPRDEMFAPYGRIILLHLGVFALGGLVAWLGDPAAGALALVLLRALWRLNGLMRSKPAAAPAEPQAAAANP